MRNYPRALYYLYSLKRSAYWDRRKLLSHQNMKLKKLVRYAYEHVPFYNKLFKKFNINQYDIRELKDLNKLPIIRKDDLRKNLDAAVSTEFDVNCLQVRNTSGSTGQPLKVFMTNKEDEFSKAKHLRANISCGQKLRDRWVTITSPTHFGEVSRIQQILGFYSPLFVSVFDSVEAQISSIERTRPDVLEGYSSSLALLAREIRKRGGVETIKPKIIIGGAELITDASRKFIEETFGVPFYDQYGTIEVRMAWQCPEKRFYHIDADTVILQFVDGDGEEVLNGERGEVVCTSLYNYAMPFIRYAVGDICVPSDDICSCGRMLPLMKIIEGRKDSILILPDGRPLSPRTFTITFNTFRLVRYIEQFRIIQKKRDFFEILLKKKDMPMDEKSLRIELIEHLRKTLALKEQQVTFDIQFVENFDLDRSGKFEIVTSELKNLPNQSNV